MTARVEFGSLGVAGMVLALLACGQTTRDGDANPARAGVGGFAAVAGSAGSLAGGAAGASVETAGEAGSTGLPGGGAGGVGAAGIGATGADCPEVGSSPPPRFEFRMDPLPEGGTTEPDMSQGEWACVLRAAELENALMVLYLDCDTLASDPDPVLVTLSASFNPPPSWNELTPGTEVSYAWRATTHPWGYFWWMRLVRTDGVPLLIAYATGGPLEPERLAPFEASVRSGVCPLQYDFCYQVERHALTIGEGGSEPITMFDHSTARLGDYRVWTSRLEAHHDIQCTDLTPFEYGVAIVFDPG